MLPSHLKPNWSSDDAVALRAFLESDTGIRALHFWVEAAPTLLDGSDVNRTLVASGCVKGFSDAVNAFIALTVEQPLQSVPEKNAWPSLDDDSAWDEKTNTPK